MTPNKNLFADHRIVDSRGNVLHRSKNLAGIRRYLGGAFDTSKIIEFLDMSKLPKDSPIGWDAVLTIQFETGVYYQTWFASFDVLRGFVQRWSNVRGCKITINGESDNA